MPNDVEIIVRGDSTPDSDAVIGRAIACWLTAAARSSLLKQMSIVLRGGPYLSPDEVADFWRAVLPAGVVEDLLVDGHSLKHCPSETRRPPPGHGGRRQEQ